MSEQDIFKRIEKIGLIEVQILRKFPHVFNFLTSLTREESDEVKETVQQTVDFMFKEGFVKLYENLDYSMFRDDIDVQRAIEILNWTMTGFGEKVAKEIDTFEGIGDQYVREWENYSNILKHSFYKSEED
ncbi:hypothetical protein VBD025_15245 [Virgibacillus flavescens]|uniref:hypothetical protein n=1 Tax=Virgibacillus flavescens TaxID=1611422 RepID=UPI003D354F9E